MKDNFDLVWGTTEKRDAVLRALRGVRQHIANHIGSPPRYIHDVAQEPDQDYRPVTLSIRELRLLRYAVSVALGEELI